ncbi:DNA transposase THAP9 [Orchesella cincta]|uniref:DNA transposase THAP9 n=1 Tax=Orchesella cincta TaxID=48709 RepID=A0A1D2MGK0_ORCCI|nr:DNA transposase THAP9 [Orchesella cincta]
MPSCFIPGCNTRKRSEDEDALHVFKIPTKATFETRQKWVSSIPRKVDNISPLVSPNPLKLPHIGFDLSRHRLCHRHFEEKYIVKSRKVSIGGQVIAEEARLHWTLSPDAVPTIFPGCNTPKYYKRVYTSRTSPVDQTLNISHEAEPDQGSNNEVEVERAEIVSGVPRTVNVANLEALSLLKIPSSWVIQRKETSLKFIEILEETGSKTPIFIAEKSLEVFKDFKFVVNIGSKEVTKQYAQPANIDYVAKLLTQLSSLTLCTGVKNQNMFTYWPCASKTLNIWFSDKCSNIVSDQIACQSCVDLKKKMRNSAETAVKNISNAKRTTTSKNPRLVKRRKMAATLKLWRLKKKNSQLKNMCLSLKATNQTALLDSIQGLNLPLPMKTEILTSVQVAKTKSKFGLRYKADWILQALLLKVTSPKAYRYIRDNKILPLPHPNHLTSLLRGIPSQFGFSDYVLGELEKAYRDKPQRDRQIMVLIDEMGCQEGITFEKNTMKFKGYIDYAEFSSDLKPSKSTKKEADHCLVIMIRFMNSKVTQPIAAFATRGAAPGNILAKMVLACITRLENVNLEVVGVVSDGASTNKSAWKELGIGVKNGKITSSIQNPVDEQRQVHFFCDMPHIIKYVRNHIHNKENVMVRAI